MIGIWAPHKTAWRKGTVQTFASVVCTVDCAKQCARKWGQSPAILCGAFMETGLMVDSFWAGIRDGIPWKTMNPDNNVVQPCQNLRADPNPVRISEVDRKTTPVASWQPSLDFSGNPVFDRHRFGDHFFLGDRPLKTDATAVFSAKCLKTPRNAAGRKGRFPSCSAAYVKWGRSPAVLRDYEDCQPNRKAVKM